jgi:two-component system phosphate regulon sensor histidine kinase PhoR
MTHEFKTPISSIALSSEAMMKNELVKNDPRLSNYTRIVKEQAERLNLQVEKVLQIAQLQTNELDLYLETLNLQELIEGVIRSTNVNYEKLGGKITFENKVGLLTVNADKMHLTNILHNLLDNSLKYNENVPEVTMILTKKEEKIQLEIKDNGIGIEEKYLKQVFDKFYRIPTGNVHNVKGFGLGLYYVKQVIKKHKWKINIKSELAKGTEVLIEM